MKSVHMMEYMMFLTQNIYLIIEHYSIKLDDFGRGNLLTEEIKNTGIKIM